MSCYTDYAIAAPWHCCWWRFNVMLYQCVSGVPCFEGVKKQMSCLAMKMKLLTVLWNTCNNFPVTQFHITGDFYILDHFLYLNHAGLVWPANAEPHTSTASAEPSIPTASAEPSIPTADARIWWTDAVLSSWSAAGTQANMGSAGTVTATVSDAPGTAGYEDAVEWSTVSKVRLAALTNCWANSYPASSSFRCWSTVIN